MTPEQWLANHYPVPASALAEASDEECLLHCENKWEGAKKEHLPEGAIYALHYVHLGNIGLIFDYSSCALCMKYSIDNDDRLCADDTGKQCPIVRMQGVPCYHGNSEYRDIYEEAENDPAPMLDLLKRTLEFVRAGG